MPFKSYREESRINYGETVSDDSKGLCREQLKLGAILRIADATEVMAKNYQTLLDERNRYKRWYDEGVESNRRLWKRIAALRGVITRMKNKEGEHEATE